MANTKFAERSFPGRFMITFSHVNPAGGRTEVFVDTIKRYDITTALEDARYHFSKEARYDKSKEVNRITIDILP